jgi:ADP-heptose:LPS heptosyltransferase
MDKIGDLILTLPVDQNPDLQHSHWIITDGLGFIAEHAQPARRFSEWPRTVSRLQFLAHWRWLRAQQFDRVVIFHAPWWVSALTWLARIPLRAGVRSQWHSFLFLNRAVRQKRSRAECSELEYGYRLIEASLGLALPRQTLKLGSMTSLPARATSTLSHTTSSQPHALSSSTNAAPSVEVSSLLPAGRYVVVHPGMAGSALNWPINNYAELVRRLCQQTNVVITGTASDRATLVPLRALLAEQAHETHLAANAQPKSHASQQDIASTKSDHYATDERRYRVTWLNEKLSGAQLIACVENASAVIVPSTGVAHIAASTGVKTIGIYSPVRVQHPRRWGPMGTDVHVLLPNVESCPGETSCLGSACRNAAPTHPARESEPADSLNPANCNCMARITVDEVLKLALS